MVNNHDAELIAQKDAVSLHETATQFWSDNGFQYYTLINTWVGLVTAHTPLGGRILEDVIREFGVIPVIGGASQLALDLLRSDFDAAELSLQEAHDVYSSLCIVIQGLSVADALQVLRFPKRFTVKSQSLRDSSVRGFKETNNRMRLVNRRPMPSSNDFMAAAVARECDYILPRRCEIEDEPRFTSGASQFGMRTYRAKYDKIKHWECENFFGTPLYAVIRLVPSRNVFRACKISSVPKSYKTYRTIAIETSTNQSRQQGIRAALEKALNKVSRYAPIHNQYINGTAASDLDMATIDMSSASDSVSIWFLGILLRDRPEWLRAIMDARSEIVEYPDGTRDLLHMAATMGNGFCFALETLGFLCIARAAVKTVCHFSGIPWKAEYVRAYGDDVIIPVWAFDTVCEWLAHFGFLVNDDKSFASSLFRESCGFDWYGEQYVSSTYWPRAFIDGTIKSVTHLVSLHNRLFERCSGLEYYEVLRFLRNQVLRIVPKLSTVPLPIYLEYDLGGRCLVGPLGHVEHRSYTTEWGLVPGDGRTYQEERLYANLLVPTKKTTVVRDTATDQNVEMYYFSTFLRHGPAKDVQHTRNGDVCTPLPLRDDSLTSVPDGGYVVARVRLI
jgi:hypothetical protein